MLPFQIMKSSTARILALTFMCCGVLLTNADTSYAQSSKSNEPDIPAPLQTMVEQGAQIRYLGREFGLDGWVTIQAGEEQYFYSTADGQGLLMGILFNNKGDAITLQQINALRDKEGPAIDRLAGYVPVEELNKASGKPVAAPSSTAISTSAVSPQDIVKQASKSRSEQLFDSVEAANWIAIGDKQAPTIYTIIDPECPHCHDLIDDFRKSSYLKRGLVQLRLIPVGVLSEKSLSEAAFLLASPNAEKDLFNHLDGQKDALLADKNINTQAVQRNMQILQDWKLDVTPFSVYKNASGEVKVLQGRPADLKNLIAELR
ncbi:MAG: hypothetical protein KDJ50_06100 [Alphaproteobacteria bacterium]|nr:hypothetical protein [Alphaproteobacteria bacterium]